MSKRRINSQAGFTLIEVGMASLILVVGFVGIIQAVTIGSQMVDTAQKQQVAVQIIDAEIERLRGGALDASSISGLTSGTAYTITVDSAGAVSGNTSYFALSANTAMSSLAKDFTVAMTKTDVRTNFRKIVFTVTWTGNMWTGGTARGLSYSRSAEMYFGLNGLQLSFQKS